MKLILTHALSPADFSAPWIYLGKNFLRMRDLKKRLSGSRISLSALMGEEAKRQRPEILDWIRRQREANGDSLHWWMSHLAGRNNAASQFFIYLIQIAALKRWVTEQEHLSGDVFVLCEDSFLLSAAQDNLGGLVKVHTRAGWQLGSFCDRIFYMARAGYCLLRQIVWFWRHARAARKTRPRNISPPEGEVYLIHQCLDDKAFFKEGPLHCRYFTVLPQWLEDQGKQVVRLPWFASISLPLDDVYRRLRSSQCLVPEDWLDWGDYVRSLWDGFKSSFAIRKDVVFKDINVSALVSRERCQQWGTGLSMARFWCYGSAMRRWGASLKKLVMYDSYEAMPPEHVQVVSWRTHMDVPSKFIGYYNSLVSRDFLAYHTPAGESNSLCFPDVIVANGLLAKDLLVAQGLDENRIQVGPALRQSFPVQAASGAEAHHEGLLLVLSLILEATIELLDKISRLAPWIQARLGVSVVVKPHPMMTRELILKHIGWETLPEGWCWHEGELDTALANTWCAIALNTAALADVVISGCIPLSLTRSLDTPWNYLDFLVDQFPVLETVPDDEIQTRLEEIFISRRESIQSEVKQVRERLLQGLNPISDKTIAAFL